jgi:hypothetical protein
MSASIRLVSDMPYVYGWMVTYSDSNRTIVAVRRDRWMLHESFGLFVRQGRHNDILIQIEHTPVDGNVGLAVEV